MGFANRSVVAQVAPALNGKTIQSDLALVAKVFVDLQQARHEADYDTSKDFSRRDCLDHVTRAEDAFKKWDTIRKTLQANVFLVALLTQSQMKG